MVKSFIYSSIILFILFPIWLYGQQDNKEYYKQKSGELLVKGSQISADGKYIEALDTFNLCLEYRKKAYGDESYYLGSPYLAIGISYKT